MDPSETSPHPPPIPKPHPTYSSVSLFAATPEQILVARKRAGEEWARGLTVQEFIDREVDGDSQEFAKDGKLITWVLAPRDDPATLDFFSSCKTFKRQIVLSHPSRGTTIETGYAVASVFTPPQHRNCGYASHMMRLLHWVLAREEYLSTQTPFPENEWGPRPEKPRDMEGGVVSVLWSGIGEEFYSLCGVGVGNGERDGWIVRDPFSVVWKMEEAVMKMERTGDVSEVLSLNERQVEELWARDAEMIKLELGKPANEEDKPQFSFVPTGGVGAYLWHRLHYYTTRYVQEPVPECPGVQITTTRGTKAFATWTLDFRPGFPRALIVTRLRAGRDTIEPLMMAILMHARRYGMEEIEVWNLKKELVQTIAKYGGRNIRRNIEFPSMKWYGPEEVAWMNNERWVKMICIANVTDGWQVLLVLMRNRNENPSGGLFCTVGIEIMSGVRLRSDFLLIRVKTQSGVMRHLPLPHNLDLSSPESAMADMVHIKASCHCTSNTFRVAFKSGRLPIEHDLCHCNSCRHSSGQLGVYHVNIDGGPYREGENVLASLENLKEYRSSPVSSRWFCTTCGAHVLWRHDSTWLLDDIMSPANEEVAKRFGIGLREQGENGPRKYWAVATGLLERVERIVRVGYHIYVGDTLDGGLADHFSGLPGEGLKRWAGQREGSELLPRGWRAPSLPPNSNHEKLQLYCQCQAVELYIMRPSPRSRPPTEEEWYIPPDPKRYLAGHCVCESCRRTAGFEITSWVFMGKENIYDGRTGELVDFEAEELRGMRVYKSSKGRRRYFCSTCGASVFCTGAEQPMVVDIALGLVDQREDGVRAENWFVWRKKG